MKYRELINNVIYREYTVEQLTKVIGNELDVLGYHKLSGTDSKQKAENLFIKFSLDKKEEPYKRRYRKNSYSKIGLAINKKFINHDDLMITIPIDYFVTKIQEIIIDNKISIFNTDLDNIRKAYRKRIDTYIEKGYSVEVSHNNQKHILIYNK